MKRLIVMLFLFVLGHFAFSQADPLSLTKAIFDREGFSELKNHITGEYKGHPNGSDLNSEVTMEFLLLDQEDDRAVVSINFADSTGDSFDCYLHFVHDSVWKATAFRSLAMTQIPYDIKTELERLTEDEIDQLILDTKNGESDFMKIKSREDFDYELGNLRLLLSTDKEIVEHFLRNEEAFNQVKNQILEEFHSAIEQEGAVRIGDDQKSSLRKLFISSVKTGGFDFSETMNFSIGGMLDNTVGYLFVPEGKSVPAMHPDRIIMIRKIGNGWYIYKTT